MMWHTSATRRTVERKYFDEHEEMWRPYKPKPARSRVLLHRSALHRSASRVLSTHCLPVPRDEVLEFCTLLNVPKDSDVEQLRRAYLRLSKRHHPDRGGDAEMFALINEAYHALADRARRARYATSNSCYGEHAAARLLPLRDG